MFQNGLAVNGFGNAPTSGYGSANPGNGLSNGDGYSNGGFSNGFSNGNGVSPPQGLDGGLPWEQDSTGAGFSHMPGVGQLAGFQSTFGTRSDQGLSNNNTTAVNGGGYDASMYPPASRVASNGGGYSNGGFSNGLSSLGSGPVALMAGLSMDDQSRGPGLPGMTLNGESVSPPADWVRAGGGSGGVGGFGGGSKPSTLNPQHQTLNTKP